MAEPIKKSDIIENDILKGVIQEFEQAKKVTDDYNKSLKESATLLKSKLSDAKIFDSNSIKEHNMAIKEANMLFQQKLKAEEQSKKNAILEERLKKEQLKTEQQLNKEKEKSIRNSERESSAYLKLNKILGNLKKEYRDLAIKKELNQKLTIAEEAKLQSYEARIQKVDGALKKVDASMGNYQRNVGNYSSAWNGLGNSVNQLTREMPAFANSVQTGFMAISNNLPMFFDEIQKIRVANQQLVAEGKSAKGVLTQLGTAIFSWGTALSIGVTLLTMYGGQIAEFISGLFTANKNLENYRKTQERINENSKKQSEYIGDEVQEYGGLIYMLKNTNAGSQERSKLITEINNKYGTHLKNISNEAKFQQQLNQTISDYIAYKRAEYDLKDNANRREIIFEKQDKARKELKKAEIQLSKDELEVKKQLSKLRVSPEMLPTRESQIRQISAESQNKVNILLNQLDYYERRLNELGQSDIKLKKVRDVLGFTENDNKQTKKELDDLTKAIAEERNKQIQDELLRKEQELILNAQYRIKDVQNSTATEKQKAELTKLIQQNLIEDIKKLRDEYYQEELKKFRQFLKEQEDAEKAQMDESYNKAVNELEKEQKQTELSIELANKSDKEKKQQLLQNEIDFLEQKLILAQKYGKEEEALDIQIQLAKLRNQEKEVEKTKFNYSQMTKIVKEFTDIVIQQSQRRIEQLDKEINQRQKNYDLYVELAKNGNITAKESLAEEQKAIVEANKKKNDEMRKQQRLKFAESAFSAYANNAEKGEKNPLLKTITDMTLLRQFIMSLPAFEKGIEDTGSNGHGVDGKGGFISVLHPNERVLTKQQNQMIGSMSNEEVADTIAKYRSGQLVSMKGIDIAGNSFNIAPLLSEIKDLKNVIKQKPETNIQLGEITQHAMTIVESKKVGNTRYNNKFIVR